MLVNDRHCSRTCMCVCMYAWNVTGYTLVKPLPFQQVHKKFGTID